MLPKLTTGFKKYLGKSGIQRMRGFALSRSLNPKKRLESRANLLDDVDRAQANDGARQTDGEGGYSPGDAHNKIAPSIRAPTNSPLVVSTIP